MFQFLRKAVMPSHSDAANPSPSCGPFAALPSAATHIRLLRIHPSGWFWAPIQCDMFTCPISDPPAFQALSYVWGTGARTHSVKLPDTELRITQSLDEAIRHLRKKDSAITLWIDQICIHQEDPDEKNLQMLLMSQIYAKAKQVLLWLGPAENGSDTVMDIWQTVGQDARDLGLESFYTEEKYPQLQPVVTNKDPADPLTIQFQALFEKSRGIYGDSLDAIIAWYRRPWFSRVWVVQEFCLCDDTVFVCGSKSVTVELVMLAVQIISFSCGKLMLDVVGRLSSEEFAEMNAKFSLLINEPVTALFTARQRRRGFDTKWTGKSTGDSLFVLMRKLYIRREAYATDRRDRIYGLLGLATDELDIVPDYSDSSDSAYRGLLCKTARAMIEKHGLEVLSYSQFPKNFIPLPSWVPDWRNNLSPSFYDHFLISSPHHFQACGKTEFSIMPSPSTSTLVLEGFTVDIVEEVGGPWHRPAMIGYEHYLNYFAQVRLMCRISAMKDQPIYASRSRRDEAVWRVPIGDLYTHNGLTTRPTSDVEGPYLSLLAECELLEQNKLAVSVGAALKLSEPDDDVIAAHSHYQMSTAGMSGKRPFLSERGYVGMGPPPMMPGDVIVIFKGSRIPSVLRPGEQGNSVFVGEAYCDGIMDGELAHNGPGDLFFIV